MPFSLLLVAGLVLRILLSLTGTYFGDFNTWLGWADRMNTVGPAEFYSDGYWCDYLPGYLYVLWLLDKIHDWIPQFSNLILFKLPANLADLGIAVVLFQVLRRVANPKVAKVAALAYFFNPAPISNSTLWGQVDSFHALPLLLAILLAIGDRFALSGVIAATAFMIKPQSIVLFPILYVMAFRPLVNWQQDWGERILIVVKQLLQFSGAAFGTALLIALPFLRSEIPERGFIVGFFHFVITRFNAAYGQYEYTSLNAFNFWGAFAMWQADNQLFLGITYKNWGTLIFALCYAVVVGLLVVYELNRSWDKAVRDPADPVLPSHSQNQIILSAATLIFFAMYLFVTRAHERHFLPTLVFFSFVAWHSRRSWLFYGVASLIYVGNMTYAFIELAKARKELVGSFPNLPSLGITLVSLMLVVIFGNQLIDFAQRCLTRIRVEKVRILAERFSQN